MIRSANYFLKLIIFWLLFFLLGRLLFLIFSADQIQNESYLEIITSFVAALSLDLITISWLLIFPLLFFVLSIYIPPRAHRIIIYIIHILLIIAFVLIIISGIRLFHEWGSLLNYRAMVFLFEPDSVTGSVALMDLLKQVLMALAYILLSIFLFFKLIKPPLQIQPKQKIIFSAILSVFIIINITGLWKKSAVTEAMVSYSDNIFLNNAATNPVWYLAHSVNQASFKYTNRFVTMPDEKAERLISELFKKGETVYVLKEEIKNPNIVIIILESWSADLIERLGGEKGVTPVFDSLSQKGILFGDIYSSGFRTDQGLVSLFSGYPAQPSHSIIQHLDKVAKLPFMPQKLKQRGYETSFYYGGNTSFSNMKSYLQLSGVDNIYGKEYFIDEGTIFTNWGAHDEFVLLKQAKDLDNVKQPFFSTVLTLSTHEPYEVPLPPPNHELSEPEMYNRSAHYTDYSLGKYFDYARTQPWYDNTLFIITADHGHRLPHNYTAYEKGIRHMPVLFYGNVIKENFHGKIIETTGNIHDLPVTILEQLNISTEEFVWSRDLLSEKIIPFAYIGYEKGFGWVKPDQEYLIYLYPQGQITQSGKLVDHATQDSLIQYPKAHIQELYRHFLAL